MCVCVKVCLCKHVEGRSRLSLNSSGNREVKPKTALLGLKGRLILQKTSTEQKQLNVFLYKGFYAIVNVLKSNKF